MSANSKIEWTDRTWNPVSGCSKVSPGCAHCYAEGIAERFRGGKAFPNGFDVTLRPEKLDEPLRWRKPARVFVNSMSDLFHEDVPFDFVSAVFGVMASSPRHTFQILTKRPERMLDWFRQVQTDEAGPGWAHLGHRYLALISEAAWLIREAAGEPEDLHEEHYDRLAVRALHGEAEDPNPWPLPNVWLGVSVESPTFVNRIEILKQVPAAVRFVSFEPLLRDMPVLDLRGIDWAIVGGESGPGARPMSPQWIRGIARACDRADAALFVKQMGSHWARAYRSTDPKGGNPEEWEPSLRRREFPEVRHG